MTLKVLLVISDTCGSVITTVDKSIYSLDVQVMIISIRLLLAQDYVNLSRISTKFKTRASSKLIVPTVCRRNYI